MTVIPDLPVERPQDEIPESSAKPDFKIALKRAGARFSQDECTDKAGALTYYMLQSLFPALIALLSLINVFGNGKETTTKVVKIVAQIAGKTPKDLEFITTFINKINTAGGGTIALTIGIAGAIWSASGYVGAFGRALNHIYDIGEGRPFIKLRPAQLLITVTILISVIVLLFSITTTGGVARAIASEVGIPSQAVVIWDIAKWPFVLLIVVFIIALLFWGTPNVRKTKRMLLSWGALVALVVWILASAALFTYFVLSSGASYQKTYGAFAGVIMLLLWLWITNLALLFGAELDAELIRTRQLKSGMPAEELILLPARDESGLEKKSDKQFDIVEQARGLRAEAERELGTPHNEALNRFIEDQAESKDKKNPYGPDVRTMRVTESQSVMDTTNEVGSVNLDRDDSSGVAKKRAVMTRSTGDPQADREHVEKVRAQRAAVAVSEARKERVARDRMAAAEAKAEKKRVAQEKKRQEQLAASAQALPQSKRWEAVEAVRNQFAPPDSKGRDDIEAERSTRREDFHAHAEKMAAKQADKKRDAAAMLPAVGAHPAAEHELPASPQTEVHRDSPSQVMVDAERAHRREQWYSGHRR